MVSSLPGHPVQNSLVALQCFLHTQLRIVTIEAGFAKILRILLHLPPPFIHHDTGRYGRLSTLLGWQFVGISRADMRRL